MIKKDNNAVAKAISVDKREVARRIANTPDGMLFIKYMQKEYLKSVFVKSDPYRTHVNIGEQNVIKRALSLIDDNDKYISVKTVDEYMNGNL